jgi:subtilisin family serine protease
MKIMAKPDKPGGGKPGGGGSTPDPQVVDWGYTRINAAAGRAATSGTAIVAVLDTGVDATHPDLAGVVIACFSAIKRADYSDCNDRNVKDDDGHGTHVAGTIGALDNSGDAVGAAAGHVLIISGKVLGKRGGAYDDIAWGIRHATDLGANIISMSLGGPSTTQGLQDAIDYATGNGVAVVAAAGNEGTCDAGDFQTSYPAMNDGVFTVGATGMWDGAAFTTDGTGEDAMPCFSNNLPDGYVNVAAPGVYITSLKKGGGVTEMSGTSMATPYVSALLALLMADGASAASAQNTLENGAIDIGYPSTMMGAGLVYF